MRKQTNRFIAEVFTAIVLLFAAIVISLVLHGCAVKKPKPQELNVVQVEGTITGSGTVGSPFIIDTVIIDSNPQLEYYVKGEKFNPVIEHSEIKTNNYATEPLVIDTTKLASRICYFGRYSNRPECDHIWVREYIGNMFTDNVPVVCVRCHKQETRTNTSSNYVWIDSLITVSRTDSLQIRWDNCEIDCLDAPKLTIEGDGTEENPYRLQ